MERVRIINIKGPREEASTLLFSEALKYVTQMYKHEYSMLILLHSEKNSYRVF